MLENDLRLLAVDGGGVCGPSTLQILKQLMKTINPESLPKPCDYFDVIGGTSTGGSVLAALLHVPVHREGVIADYLAYYSATGGDAISSPIFSRGWVLTDGAATWPRHWPSPDPAFGCGALEIALYQSCVESYSSTLAVAV